MQFWVEKLTSNRGLTGCRASLHLGQFFGSPRLGRMGDTYRLMRDVKPGDIVFHFIDKNAIAGVQSFRRDAIAALSVHKELNGKAGRLSRPTAE